MKKPFVLVAAMLAVVGLGTVAAVAKDTRKVKDRTVKTSVKLEFTADPDDPYPDDPSSGSFSGRVKAKHDCQKRRRVVLYTDRGIAGFDKSNARGKFEFVGMNGAARERDAHRRGTAGYRAVAQERTITKQNGDKIVCKAGTSERVTAPVPFDTGKP